MTVDLNHPRFVDTTPPNNGKQLKIPASAVNGTTGIALHTATANKNEWDVVTIEVTNIDLAAPRLLAIQWGGTTTDDQVAVTVQPQTTMVAIDRRRIRGGLQITAWEAAATQNLRVYTQVERYTESAA